MLAGTTLQDWNISALRGTMSVTSSRVEFEGTELCTASVISGAESEARDQGAR